jgi:hypothetical protein
MLSRDLVLIPQECAALVSIGKPLRIGLRNRRLPLPVADVEKSTADRADADHDIG